MEMAEYVAVVSLLLAETGGRSRAKAHSDIMTKLKLID